ncbi:hypothetical protein BAUCODRAFT_181205 [Baudoinia panamericana UAMH 10762]|uniref:Uncharacterized protein n=1 Tax=Baudoinia panamericana (strain UAMH 10762) TaxID=717646 RepID=M2N987_BAUPA|nr:uncharacterized protein BAUCODRAFT_181205 [Baudoinia panamericana UAMH 10762]EMD00734.1 hypothetical protein BAUCODRAFT_181205 [Baudoinia panamericana UAMH 10762]
MARPNDASVARIQVISMYRLVLDCKTVSESQSNVVRKRFYPSWYSLSCLSEHTVLPIDP